MMRRLFAAGLIFVAQVGFCDESLAQRQTSGNSAVQQPVDTRTKFKEYPSIFEFKAGYFFFSDSTLRKVYDQGGIDLQISGSGSVWKWVYLYGSAEYLARHGRSLNFGSKTNIWMLPLSFGIRPVVPIRHYAQYYITIGPRYAYVHMHNNSPFVDKVLVRHAFGGFANTGFNFFPTPYIAIDVFAEYSYIKTRMSPSEDNVFANRKQIGGFTFGAGLGYAF